MRRRYIYFLLTYFHNSSKKAHITKYSIKSTVKGENGTFSPFTQAGVKNLAEHRYMCIEDDTTHRRVVILQADQTVTGDSMDLRVRA